jgi:hypothetical protein
MERIRESLSLVFSPLGSLLEHLLQFILQMNSPSLRFVGACSGFHLEKWEYD